MAEKSKIQWTDATWNVARGCTKVDEDCKFCYMYRESMNGTRYDAKQVVRTKTVFNLPDRIKEPSKIFMSSLTDWAHPDIDPYRHEIFEIIRRHPEHTFQALTKRTERLTDICPPLFSMNIWLGASIGSMNAVHRVKELIRASLILAPKKTFLSIEPLWDGPIDLTEFYFTGMGFDHLKRSERTKMIELLDWVIIGGESGNEKGMYQYRECKLEWIENIIEQCKKAKVAVFVKQLGTHLSKKLGLKDRHGGDITEWPKHLQIRQMPYGTN